MGEEAETSVMRTTTSTTTSTGMTAEAPTTTSAAAADDVDDAAGAGCGGCGGVSRSSSTVSGAVVDRNIDRYSADTDLVFPPIAAAPAVSKKVSSEAVNRLLLFANKMTSSDDSDDPSDDDNDDVDDEAATAAAAAARGKGGESKSTPNNSPSRHGQRRNQSHPMLSPPLAMPSVGTLAALPEIQTLMGGHVPLPSQLYPVSVFTDRDSLTQVRNFRRDIGCACDTMIVQDDQPQQHNPNHNHNHNSRGSTAGGNVEVQGEEEDGSTYVDCYSHCPCKIAGLSCSRYV